MLVGTVGAMLTAPTLEVSEPTFWSPCEQLPTAVGAPGEAQAVSDCCSSSWCDFFSVVVPHVDLA